MTDNVIYFTPEGEGKKALMDSAENVAEDVSGWALVTWDEEGVAGVSILNNSAIPDNCIPEWLYRIINDSCTIP